MTPRDSDSSHILAAEFEEAQAQVQQDQGTSLRQLDTVLSCLYSGVLLVSDSGVVELANQAFCDSFKLSASPAELRGLTSKEMFNMIAVEYASPSEMKIRIRDWIAQGEPVREAEVAMRDGRVLLLDFIPVVTAGQSLGWVWHHQDITKRKTAEAALRSSENVLRTFVDSYADMVYLKDSELRHLVANPALCQFFGRSEAEVLGKSDEELMPPEAAERCRSGDLEVLQARAMLVQEEPVGDRVFETRKFAVPLADGSWGVGGTIRDISDRRRAEEERSKLEAQLQQAQKMESVGRLAGGVAHDFNNMLGVILGNVELALEQFGASDPMHDLLEDIDIAAKRSADLTRQLLAFARRQTVAPRVIDLNRIVQRMLTMLRRLIGEDIELLWQPAPCVWPVEVDPSQIDQVLANLCLNARDAISGVGKMTIEIGNCTFDAGYCLEHADASPGEYVRLAVSDDGCGMDLETQAHLFEPFYTTKPQGRGTGLGLAMVYGIVKQNNGFTSVQSEPNKGTTISVYLPRSAGKAEGAQSVLPTEPTVRGQETILLVEDEATVLRMATRMLERQGYTVLAAATPGEAIRLASERQGEIRLLITDVVMPEMNGRDLAKLLLARNPGLKCLFMSGYTATVVSNNVLEEGVHFIQKPFSIERLGNVVRDVLDREGESEPDATAAQEDKRKEE